MYQLLISNYEGKQQELRVENTDLRDCLVDMQRELASLCETTDHTISDLQSKVQLIILLACGLSGLCFSAIGQ